jgi:hypothetical protein
MTAKRVHELATELHVESADVLAALATAGVAKVTHHMSSIDEQQIAAVRRQLGLPAATPSRRLRRKVPATPPSESTVDATVVRFDPSSGVGEIVLKDYDAPVHFDLASVKLKSAKFSPIAQGKHVKAVIRNDRVETMTLD